MADLPTASSADPRIGESIEAARSEALTSFSNTVVDYN